MVATTRIMKKIVLILALIFVSCSNDGSDNEATIYGDWFLVEYKNASGELYPTNNELLRLGTNGRIKLHFDSVLHDGDYYIEDDKIFIDLDESSFGLIYSILEIQQNTLKLKFGDYFSTYER